MAANLTLMLYGGWKRIENTRMQTMTYEPRPAADLPAGHSGQP